MLTSSSVTQGEPFYRFTISYTVQECSTYLLVTNKVEFTQREGYARISGKPGVVIATSGPGATNIVTGLADAMIDSLPLVVFTGQVASSVIGSDAFQEADVLGITMPITKHSYQVRNISDMPRIIKEAFHIATTGRPGPVLIDIPKDMAQGDGTFNYEGEIDLPGYQPTYFPNQSQVKKLTDAVATEETCYPSRCGSVIE